MLRTHEGTAHLPSSSCSNLNNLQECLSILKVLTGCLCVAGLGGVPALLPIPAAHTQAHTKSDIVQALTPFLWFAFIFSLRTEHVYTKGGFSAGLPAALSPFFFLSLAVACSCSKSQLGSCSQELGLEELSASSRQGVLWVTCSDTCGPSGPASLLAARLPCPSAWPPGLLLLSTGCL